MTYLSPRSGRRRKAWGEAQRNPRLSVRDRAEPAERPIAESQLISCDIGETMRNSAAVGRFAGCTLISYSLPGVSLRSTPGFTLPSASRTQVSRRQSDEVRRASPRVTMRYNVNAEPEKSFRGLTILELVVHSWKRCSKQRSRLRNDRRRGELRRTF